MDLADHTDEGGVLTHLHRDVLHAVHKPGLHPGSNW